MTLGLAVGAAAVGQTWLSGALAGAVVRASTKAYQSYKEGKKSLFEGAPVRGGRHAPVMSFGATKASRPQAV